MRGMYIICVPSETEVEHDGKKLVVTDTNAVRRGRSFYVTALIYEKLKAHTTPKEPHHD